MTMKEIKTTKDMRTLLKDQKNIFEARDLLYELGDNVSREVINIDHETTLYEEVHKIELEDGAMFVPVRIKLTIPTP